MGDVVQFPRPARPEPEHGGLSEDEYTRYLTMLSSGYGEDKAIELLALRRRAEGGDRGDYAPAS